MVPCPWRTSSIASDQDSVAFCTTSAANLTSSDIFTAFSPTSFIATAVACSGGSVFVMPCLSYSYGSAFLILRDHSSISARALFWL
jgi:hypothetical protein